MTSKKRSTTDKKFSSRRACIILDVAILVLIATFVVVMLIRSSSYNYDVDRALYPVKGIDISAHNGDIDFLRVAADTVSFVIIKATEGTDFCDAKFNANYIKAKEAGLKVGAYHFFRFDTPSDIQAQHFLSSISDRSFELPLAIDVEKWGNVKSYDTEKVKQSLRRFVDVVKDAGYPVMIYTNKDGYTAFIGDDFSDVPLWICSLSAPPSIEKWTLWQHSHRNHVDGVKEIIDLNTFNGDTALFNNWTRPFYVSTD